MNMPDLGVAALIADEAEMRKRLEKVVPEWAGSCPWLKHYFLKALVQGESYSNEYLFRAWLWFRAGWDVGIEHARP